jgi:aldehyde dehydrogenase (NAD+)
MATLSGTDSIPTVHLRVGGECLSVGSGGTHAHVQPATGEIDAGIPLAGSTEMDQAVLAAHEAFEGWRRTPPKHRRRMLDRLADLIEGDAQNLARLQTLDNGTPIATTGHMVPQSAEWIRYYAGWADKLTGEVTGTIAADREFSYTVPQPYGVIGVIITWNGPLISLCMKVPAALAAGNTVVVKPSELTPFTAERFGELVAEAGIPDGVVNILPGGAEAGEALVTHPLVEKITFTGGPATASRILHACADQIKPVLLELGGKSANIVFDDADLDSACAMGAVMSIGVMAGQGCALPTRMLVQETLYEEAVERVAAAASGIPVGDPMDPRTITGPLVSQAAIDRVTQIIERAPREGARLVAGGGRLDRPGFFLEPTVFADVDPDSELAQGEVFGPVLSMTSFTDEQDAVRIANSTRYGLSGYVQTRDIARGLRVAEELVTGEVLINGFKNIPVHRPFGGTGLSGYGKEGGRAGIDEFLRIKGVSVGRS